MPSKNRPKVLIVGAGPVGMYGALALAKRGVEIQIVDTGLWACSHSYALALHPHSLALLKEAGLDQQVWQAACPVRTIGLCDETGPRVRIKLKDGGENTPVAVVRQSALEDLLEKALAAHGVRVCWRHEVAALGNEPDHAVATVHKLAQASRGYLAAQSDWFVGKSRNLEPQFVLGADGHESRVRNSAALDFPEVAPAQYYAVFEFRSDVDLANEVRVVLGERTTDVLWPLPDGYCRWSFQLPDFSDTEAEQLKDRLAAEGFGHFPTKRLKDRVPAAVEWGNPPMMDETHLRALIAERAPWFQGKIGTLNWRTIVRFERRLASRFGLGRLWLAGDAAHLASPIGVQSMNLGLQEASELADCFAQVLDRKGSTALLEQYNERWTDTWRQLQGMSGGFSITRDTDPWIRERLDRLASCFPAGGKTASALAAQLGLEFATAQVAK